MSHLGVQQYLQVLSWCWCREHCPTGRGKHSFPPTALLYCFSKMETKWFLVFVHFVLQLSYLGIGVRVTKQSEWFTPCCTQNSPSPPKLAHCPSISHDCIRGAQHIVRTQQIFVQWISVQISLPVDSLFKLRKLIFFPGGSNQPLHTCSPHSLFRLQMGLSEP